MVGVFRSVTAPALLVLACLLSRDAFACACCTDPGQRRVGTEKLDSGKHDEIQRVRFARPADSIWTMQGSTGSRASSRLRSTMTSVFPRQMAASYLRFATTRAGRER